MFSFTVKQILMGRFIRESERYSVGFALFGPTRQSRITMLQAIEVKTGDCSELVVVRFRIEHAPMAARFVTLRDDHVDSGGGDRSGFLQVGRRG
jgi:hypothetical protein